MTEEKKGWFRAALDKADARIESTKAQQAAAAAQAGNRTIQKQFGLTTIEIYDGGFVRVGKMITGLTPYEQMTSIEYDERVQDRSAIGHTLYGGGPLGSKQRRMLALTIATDRKVHTLSTEAEWLSRDDKAGKALEAAGQAVLDALSSSAIAPQPQVTAEPDVADQIRKLADLHAANILTDEEFAAKKADLLSRM